MSGAAPKIRPWSGTGALSPAMLEREALPIVLAIATPDTSIRDHARRLARQTLQEALGRLLGCAPHTVRLASQPGQPLRLEAPDAAIGLSVSHERGLTFAAIRPGGPVGIDLMRVEPAPDWMPDWEPVAHAYLGERSAQRLARTAPSERPLAFAREWTRLEAALKCHGMPLQEWSRDAEQALLRCRFFELDLPAGFAGMLASA